jgi:hypothetical protein
MEFLCTLSGMNAVTRHVKIGICNWQWRGKTTSREADGIDSGLSWGLKNNQDWLFIKKMFEMEKIYRFPVVAWELQKWIKLAFYNWIMQWLKLSNC